MAPSDQSYPPQPTLLDLLTANAWAPPTLPLFPSVHSQLPAAEDQWRPSPLASPSNAQSDRFSGWPLRQAPTNALPPPTVLAASDQALPRPWWGPPPGPSVFDEWKKWNDRGNAGLYNFLRSFGGSGSTPRRDDEDYCYDRWEKELARCVQFRPFGLRYYKACTDRANHRHNLCVRNGGKPDPNEPDEYDFNDIPRDDPGR
jgi:hypothetical protein